jgi:hypothetical protein
MSSVYFASLRNESAVSGPGRATGAEKQRPWILGPSRTEKHHSYYRYDSILRQRWIIGAAR